MYFKRLEILGFKSFCDKTILHFEPGITAVVGPNGCGKSNIFDSIRWVLGEQSVKALRGSDMQDVIFNGTETKESLSMAEVSVVFDNSNKFFCVDNDEVMITRRIFRSGESEYLLNKSQVRLKDIMDILMGTGIGAESYSLVQQGKIDLVLSSKPEDRRLVFDEASGITKYKSQKREALRKLEETDQNLLRVNDIITEVKRQIGSLERQANKARRYREVFDELKAKEIAMARIQKKNLLLQKDQIINSLKELEVKEESLLNAIKEQEAAIFSRQSELRAVESAINSIKTEIVGFENTVARSNQHIAFNTERIKELEAAKADFEAQIEQAKARLAQDEEKLNNFKVEYESISKNIEEKTLLFNSKEAELNEISLSIKHSLEAVSDAKRRILDLETRIANAKNSVNEISSKQQVFLARKKRLEIEKAKVNEEKNSSESNLAAVNQEVQALEAVFSDLNSKVADFRKDLDLENVSIKTIDSDLEALEKQNLALISNKEFLSKLKTEYEGIGESMNAVIYLDKLPQDKLGGLVIKVNAYPDTGNEAQPQEQAGFKLAGEAKPIDLDTSKISARIEEIEHKIDSLKMIKRLKESRIDELNKEIMEFQDNIRAQEIALANKKAVAASIQEQFDKIKNEEEVIAIELSDVDGELNVLSARAIESHAELVCLEAQEKEAEELILSEQNNVSAKNKLKEESLVIITQLKTELEALNRRITTDTATLKMLEDSCSRGVQNLENLSARINEAQAKTASLTLEISDLESKVLESSREIDDKSRLLKDSEDKYRALVDDSSGIVNKIEADRKELDSIKNNLYDLQMQNKDVDFKYLNIKERLIQAYKIDIEELVGEEAVSGLEDENVLSEEIKRLKDKIDSYGSVNLVAIEEYDELKKRYDFLTQQQSDLVTAKDSLHDAILKINRTTKKMFLETFELVRVEFRNFFRLLFNGGDAQLFLTDENDPLESGIEIICRPPGKKLQNVLLLSGGEKSMAAIALIFAIFKVKPAPFCILDEIDAALDEANVDRFGRMVQEFVKDSQFIVITHNKKTIANANVMYGITMQESGVSKIVSVKFAQDKKVENKEPDTDPVGEPV